MQPEQILQLCRSSQAPPLAAWLGNPLPVNQAEACLELLRDLTGTSQQDAPTRFNHQLVRMIARYWLDQDAGMDYQTLAATVTNPRDRAQLELGYGQLLIARKQSSAWQYLETGFTSAANLFDWDEYFVVLQRHAALRQIPLSQNATPGVGLDELLIEAGVIRQIRREVRLQRSATPLHQDTVG